MILHADTETFSAVPITHGTYKYTANCEVMIFTYAFDNDPTVHAWDLTTGTPCPGDLEYYLAEADEITFHNSMFDRNALKNNLGPIVLHEGEWLPLYLVADAACVDIDPGFRVDIAVERIRDTMVQALTHSLPGGLGKIGDILGLAEDDKKDKRGKQLINLFCKPNKFCHSLKREHYQALKFFKAAIAEAESKWTGRATRDTHPLEWAEFIEYAKSDIRAMRVARQKMPTWNYRPDASGQQRLALADPFGGVETPGAFEFNLWCLDQRINDRGIAIDLDLARGALAAVAEEQKRLKDKTYAITAGELGSTSKGTALLKHLLAEHGVELPDLQGATIERRLQDQDLPWAAKELLMIRQQVATTSTSKYNSLLRAVSGDGRLRGTLQFCGANRTGRWAGRTFQPHNLPSRNLLPPDEIEIGIADIKAGIANVIHDNVMHLCSSAIRGALKAPVGRKLCIADFSNIEGRDQAWLAGEAWKLNAFRLFDTFKRDEDGEIMTDASGKAIRLGPDMYKLAYSKSFRKPVDAVDDKERQVGKVQELALGYEGGVGAFLTFSLVYGIDLDAMAEMGRETIPADVWAEAEGMWDWYIEEGRNTFDLPKETFMVCDSFKRLWRRAHPNITQMWKDLGDSVRAAIENPEERFDCGPLKIKRSGQWLRVQLPSGRTLVYPQPKVLPGNVVSYLGVDQYTRKWKRIKSYGGKLFENVCQAVARDYMAYSMPLAEAAGYEIVLTVHDELVTETPDSEEFSSAGLVKILTTAPPWAEGMPLAAAGFETARYRKG